MDVLVLCRHGESVYSAEKWANGDPRILVPLTAHGRMQAWRARERVPDTVGAYVTSRFIRTIETADLALAGRDLPHTIDPRFDDIRDGMFEGDSLEAYHAWLRAHGPHAAPPGGGESRVQVMRRCAEGLRALMARPEGTIFLVTHDMLLNDIMAAAHGKPPPLVGEHRPYAEPYMLTSEQVRRAADILAGADNQGL